MDAHANVSLSRLSSSSHNTKIFEDWFESFIEYYQHLVVAVEVPSCMSCSDIDLNYIDAVFGFMPPMPPMPPIAPVTRVVGVTCVVSGIVTSGLLVDDIVSIVSGKGCCASSSGRGMLAFLVLLVCYALNRKLDRDIVSARSRPSERIALCRM
jgi:hypothetical protein